MPANVSPSKLQEWPKRAVPRPAEQTPPQQATLTVLPPNLLPALAEEAGTTPELLSTLTVTRNSELFLAITEYVAIASPTVPLHSDTLDDSSSSSSDDEIRPSIRRYRNRLRTRIPCQRKSPPVPVFQLALGFARIVWPPPEHLKASALAIAKGRKPFHNSRTADKENGKEEKEGKPFTIYIANYAVGMPDPKGLVFKELLLASTEGNSALRKFAIEVAVWNFEKKGQKPEKVDRFVLFRYKPSYSEWCSEGWKRTRLASTVVLPSGMMEEILEDVARFLKPETKDWYIQHGLPQRRSYLFYGPPGTGKTSTIRVIASKFKLSCCFLSMASRRFDNESLGDALTALPEKALIVVEDVDALFNKDRQNAYDGNLTFSGLLNALDGLVSADGVITILTTNHLDRLDKALIRGGRVDRRFHFDRPNDDQLRALFRSFYPDAEDKVIKKFLNLVMDRHEEEAKCISTLQQLFIKMRENTAEECAAGVSDFFEKHLPPDEDLRYIYI